MRNSTILVPGLVAAGFVAGALLTAFLLPLDPATPREDLLWTLALMGIVAVGLAVAAAFLLAFTATRGDAEAIARERDVQARELAEARALTAEMRDRMRDLDGARR